MIKYTHIAIGIIYLLVGCTPTPPQNLSGLSIATFDPNVQPIENTPALAIATSTPLALQQCTESSIERAMALIPDYVPSSHDFIRIQEGIFVEGTTPYPIYGINYYPRDFPDHRFLTEMDVDFIDFELDLLHVNGLNTLRIFIRHEDLFACEANGAIPRPENLVRLDQFIQLAGTRGYRLIVVLHHAPDWATYPLYDMPPHIHAQTRYITERYRDEPVIMAYDLRDAGDIDYRNNRPYRRTAVLRWLDETAQLIRETAPNQLITASWDEAIADTLPYVDFIGIRHFDDVDALRQKIAIATTIAHDKPIVITAIGYATYDIDELAQRELIYRALEAIGRNALAGWMIWVAFDYPLTVLCREPNCPTEDGVDNRFGIWNTSYFPKRALDAIRLATGVAQEGN